MLSHSHMFIPVQEVESELNNANSRLTTQNQELQACIRSQVCREAVQQGLCDKGAGYRQICGREPRVRVESRLG